MYLQEHEPQVRDVNGRHGKGAIAIALIHHDIHMGWTGRNRSVWALFDEEALRRKKKEKK